MVLHKTLKLLLKEGVAEDQKQNKTNNTKKTTGFTANPNELCQNQKLK